MTTDPRDAENTTLQQQLAAAMAALKPSNEYCLAYAEQHEPRPPLPERYSYWVESTKHLWKLFPGDDGGMVWMPNWSLCSKLIREETIASLAATATARDARLVEETQRELREKLRLHEEAEASVCPEDVGFVEFIGVLRKDVAQLHIANAQMREALVTMLASAVPHPVEHPTMTAAWEIGRAAITTDDGWLPKQLDQARKEGAAEALRSAAKVLTAPPFSVDIPGPRRDSWNRAMASAAECLLAEAARREGTQ